MKQFGSVSDYLDTPPLLLMASLVFAFAFAWAAQAAIVDAGVPITVSLVSTVPINTISKSYASYNIDPSCNRGFHQTVLSNANLVAAAAALQPARLRFGGSGADNLVYGLTNGAPECANVPPAPPPLQPGCDYITPGCMNATWWNNLHALSSLSGSDLLFGVSYSLNDACAGGASWAWDTSNVRVLIDYIVAHNQTIWGFELGNGELCDGVWEREKRAPACFFLTRSDSAEVNNNGGSPCNLLPKHQAAAFELFRRTLSDAKVDAVLVGPDTGGRYPETWLRAFLPLVQPDTLHAVTHHVYNGLSRTTFASPQQLDNSLPEIAWYMSTLRTLAPHAEPWAGENGPTGGGDDGTCGTHSVCGSYAETMWYADDMSLRAKHGFIGYQRQDLFGGAYGLTSSTSNVMALAEADAVSLHPSFWTSFVWKRTLGTSVLNATSSSPLLRAYAYAGVPPSQFAAPECASQLQLVLLNLNNGTSTVSLPSSEAGTGFAAWTLTPAGGDPFSVAAVLNGAALPTVVDVSGGTDPRSFLGRIVQPAFTGSVAAGITLPGLSSTFVCYTA